jgi:iron(III) transport system ATP-binding protein
VSAVTAQGIQMRFGSQPVLSDLDLEVPEGSITAILGPSGCGKTTLLRILAGFLNPDAGVVRLGDRIVVGAGRPVPPQHRRVGYVPQEGALFPHLDVAANITFGLSRSDRRGRRIDEMLELVELPTTLASRFPHELSGGQQQRVALARALAPEPTVVLLDEPFSSLDASLRDDTGRSVVHALRAAGATAILVTHDQAEALSLADRVGVMRDGRLVQIGSPTELYLTPIDSDVAIFVGGATMLPAHVEGGVARCALGDLDVGSAGASGDVRVLVRPEQIQINDGDGNGIPAHVAEVNYYGHDAAVRLDLLAGGTRVVARVVGLDAPDQGSVVHLEVRGSAMVFDAESEPVEHPLAAATDKGSPTPELI